MNISLPLANDKKLVVTYRLEPGCLGPSGVDHIETFCVFAEKGVLDVDSDFVDWHITPRYNKALAEMRYTINGRELDHDKAAKYLGAFDKSLDDCEGHLQDKLAALIDQYWKR